VDFDLQSIWTAEGLAAAAIVVGLIFGFVQSAVPAITNSGTFRNYALIALSALLVGAAAVASGAQPSIENVFGGVLVFIGLYNAAKNLHGAGESAAKATVNGSTITHGNLLGGPADGE
jgi:hypothetical protein